MGLGIPGLLNVGLGAGVNVLPGLGGYGGLGYVGNACGCNCQLTPACACCNPCGCDCKATPSCSCCVKDVDTVVNTTYVRVGEAPYVKAAVVEAPFYGVEYASEAVAAIPSFYPVGFAKRNLRRGQ